MLRLKSQSVFGPVRSLLTVQCSMQKYTIRDLNTGQLFALCKDPSLDPESPEAASALEQVTDFASGKQLSLEEFDIALGLRRKASH